MRKIGLLRAMGECAAVIAAAFAGMVFFAVSVSTYAAAVGMLAGAALALFFIRLGGEDVSGFGVRAAPFGRSVLIVALLVAFAVGLFIYAEPWLEAQFGPVDLSAFAPIEANPSLFLLMLAVSWTGAAIGEEVVYRGFVMTRLAQAFSFSAAGWLAALLIQTAIFAGFHAYQGATGMIEVFIYGLILGLAYLVGGRSLWPVVIAHGLVDTLAMTDFYFGMKYTEALRALF